MILVALLSLVGTSSQTLIFQDNNLTLKQTFLNNADFNETLIEQLVMRSDYNYVLYDDMLALINQMQKEFPEVITLSSFGKTFEERDMMMVTLTSNQSATTSMMITGAHHSRELSSIQLPLLGVLKILHRYTLAKQAGSKTDQVFDLLSKNKLYMVPAVNIDGYQVVSKYLEQNQTFVYKRKNNNFNYENGSNCGEIDGGVDLNRNYDQMFGQAKGSSSNPCAQDFRGPSAFSEPETQAMRDLFTSKKDELKMVYNVHTYGNLFVTPISSQKQNTIHTLYPQQDEIYKEIWRDGGFPAGNIKGNGWETVGYGVDGEASDWLFTNFQIISASPELGVNDFDSFSFYIEDRQLVLRILQENIQWVYYSYRKLGAVMGFQLANTVYDRSQNQLLNMTVNLMNKGFSQWQQSSTQAYMEFNLTSSILFNLNVESNDNVTLMERITNEDQTQTLVVRVSKTLFQSREKQEIQVTGNVKYQIGSYQDDDVFLQFQFQANPTDPQSTVENVTLWDLRETDDTLVLFEVKESDGGFMFMIVGITGVLIVLIALLVTGIVVVRKKNQELKQWAKNNATENDVESQSQRLLAVQNT